MEGDCVPASPQLPPSPGGSCGGWGYTEGQASFRPKIERTKWLYWGGSNHLNPPSPHRFCHRHIVHVLRGVLWVLGSSQGPLTCLWQLWRDQEVGERVGGPPPKQAVRAPALGVEAVVGQPGLCQSPSRVRWDRGLQQG